MLGMEGIGGIDVLFVLGFGPIVADATASRKLYGHVLGIHFTEEDGGYLHTEALEGVKTFALWPIALVWAYVDVPAAPAKEPQP